MTSAYPKYIAALALATLCSTTATLPASAGVYDVKPIRLFLSKDSTSAILTIQNQDTAPLRLQVSGLAWSNNRNGQPQFKPTDDLIVFPTLVTMNALEQRNVRIGFSGTPPAEKEVAYRIMLDELPSLDSQISKARIPGVSVRTRITVPVFFTPNTVVQKVQIESVSMQHGVAQTVLSNLGNVHAIAQNAQFSGEDTKGSRIFSKSLSGWYVLAGESRAFTFSIPRSQCVRLKQLSVTVTTDIGSFTRTTATSPSECN